MPAPFPEHNGLVTFCWACDEFTKDNGSTKVIPKTHLLRRHPNSQEIEECKGAIATECPAGDVPFDTADASLPLLHQLWEQAITPEFTCRFRWQTGTLAIWDNRCTMHYAHNDYAGCRRVMRRIPIEGDRPV